LKEVCLELKHMKDLTGENYDNQDVFVIPEMTKAMFENRYGRSNYGNINCLIRDMWATTFDMKKSLPLKRRVIMVTRQDPRKWDWGNENKSRIVLLELKSDGSYQYYMWRCEGFAPWPDLEKQSPKEVKKRTEGIELHISFEDNGYPEQLDLWLNA
jgi:hypothetical protein